MNPLFLPSMPSDLSLSSVVSPKLHILYRRCSRKLNSPLEQMKTQHLKLVLSSNTLHSFCLLTPVCCHGDQQTCRSVLAVSSNSWIHFSAGRRRISFRLAAARLVGLIVTDQSLQPFAVFQVNEHQKITYDNRMSFTWRSKMRAILQILDFRRPVQREFC